MANLHPQFLEYNSLVRLNDQKRNELILARDALRIRIESRYHPLKKVAFIDELLEFQSQGSFVMDTIIKPVHDDYDLDDGVYFIGTRRRDQRPNPEVFHRLIVTAIGIDYNEVASVKDKTTCVRVVLKKGFHIDIPIYYAGDKKCPDLAHKEEGYILSNPVEFITWFEAKVNSGFRAEYLYEAVLYNTEYQKWLTDIRKQDHQLRRLVRYLKSWGDLRREEMPCGLVMTILVANNYYPHERDDISLKETLILIHSTLRKSFRCDRPTTPKGEDLLNGYKNKDAFMKYLLDFIENAKQAIIELDAKKACSYWQKSLGVRFPCQNVQIVSHNSSELSGLIMGAASSRPWGKLI